MKHTKAGPNVQERSSENEKVEQLVRAAEYVKGTLEVSLRESDGIKNSADAVEDATAEPRPHLKLIDLVRWTVVCHVNTRRCTGVPGEEVACSLYLSLRIPANWGVLDE